MKLVVGLGNPGLKYRHTRHNVGFDVVDILAKRHGEKVRSRINDALCGRIKLSGEDVLLVKPQTFMNASGRSVARFLKKEPVEIEDILVIYDDLDLPLGRIRIRPSGGAGGHRGMGSIIESIGSKDFPRIRIGIEKRGNAADHVLSRFSRDEKKVVPVALEQSADAVEHIVKEGLDSAMNLFNRNES